MNTIGLALCLVIVISFTVTPVVAVFRCPTTYKKVSYNPEPLSTFCNPFHGNRDCANHKGTHCIPLDIEQPHEVDTSDPGFAPDHGCCMPADTDNAEHSNKKRKALHSKQFKAANKTSKT